MSELGTNDQMNTWIYELLLLDIGGRGISLEIGRDAHQKYPK